MRILLDGPYGGLDMRMVNDCEKLVVIAGGSGAGWCLPLITAFLRRCATIPDERSSMRVILATRDMATQQWFEAAVADLTASTLSHSETRPQLLTEIYYTGGANSRSAPETTHQSLHQLEDPEKAPWTRSDSRTASDTSGSANLALSNVRRFNSRPRLPAVITEEAEGRTGSLGVCLCGPHSMQNEVSNAVAQQQLLGMEEWTRDVHLHTESFSWA